MIDHFRWQRYHWFLVPAALGFGAIAWRAILEPLSGFDTPFRWDFLARQMLRLGSLHFYPPVNADDFLHYGWCDGIAPLVSSLYFWAYLSLGQMADWATTPIVIGQALLLFWAVYQLAARRVNAAAGCAATAILATSGVLLWGVAMGQETGLTALSLIAMFLFIERHRDDPSAHWLVWAGVAAGTGALAREYGLAFAALGGLALAWQRVPRRGWLEFALAVAVVALPWFARNWLKTGNPLYSYALGGLFPANPVSAEYYRVVGQLHGLGAEASPLPGLAILLGSLAGVPLALGCGCGRSARPRAAMCIRCACSRRRSRSAPCSAERCSAAGRWRGAAGFSAGCSPCWPSTRPRDLSSCPRSPMSPGRACAPRLGGTSAR
jgi:hypothetical protein